MSGLASDVTLVFSTLTIVAEVLGVILLLSLIFKSSTWGRTVVKFVSRRALIFSFIVSLCAVVGSLLYSEVVLFEPCKLCWIQRIFMYPQIFLLAVALWKKDVRILAYTFVLSVLGFAVALYHYLLQRGIVHSAPCSITGVSCDKILSLSYGHITIPFMAFSAFTLLILIALSRKVGPSL